MTSTRKTRIVRITYPRCSLVHSTGSCTATRDDGNECWNARADCQVPAAYTPADAHIYFCDPGTPPIHNLNVHRKLRKVGVIPGKIPERGVGGRDQVTITIDDFEHDDWGMDPYRCNRAPQGGTYWKRFLRRNRTSLKGGSVSVFTGEVPENGFVDLDDDDVWTAAHYILEEVSPGKGRNPISVVAKDILARCEWRQVPPATTGELSAGVDASTGTWTLKSGQGAQYGTPDFYLACDKEIVKCTVRSTDTLTVTRAQGGTTAALHSADRRVQLVYEVIDEAVDDALDALLEAAGIPAANRDTTGYATEVDGWMASWRVKVFIMKPTDALELAEDLAEQVNGRLYWDAATAKMKFRLNRPLAISETPYALTEGHELCAGTVHVKPQTRRRINRCVIFFGVEDWSLDWGKQDEDAPAYTAVRDYADENARDTDEYGDERDLVLYSYWIPANMTAAMESMAFRVVNARRDTPEVVAAHVPQSVGDELSLARVVTVDSQELVDSTGANRIPQGLITSISPPATPDDEYQIEVDLEARRYKTAYWAPSGTAAYPTDTAYGHWGSPGGLMPNGDEAYVYS